MLRRLLARLEAQQTGGVFDYSVVVVDNDKSESARQVAEEYSRQSKIPINYLVEPEQNIALARNRAVDNAKGDFLGFIDDDEFPIEQWLLFLFRALNAYKADGILGPVLPFFEEEPPKWVRKGHFFDRVNHPTGHILDFSHTRTGNVLIKRVLFEKNRNWFDPAFGSGGEDRDFFKRKINKGHIFVWCNEAQVFETIPPNRWKRKVLLKRALLRGKMATRKRESLLLSCTKSIMAILVYGIYLPFSLMLGYHYFVENLIKCSWHCGKVFGFLGIDLVKENYVSG